MNKLYVKIALTGAIMFFGSVSQGWTQATAFVDDVWYFGLNLTTNGAPSAGIRFVKDVSNNYIPQDASSDTSQVYTWENSLVVSSPYCEGQVIFYSSHSQLYNSLHKPMTNGAFTGHSSTADGLAACYMGNNKYLFFSVTGIYSDAKELRAYVVDMNANNGQGARIAIANEVVEASSFNVAESVVLIACAGTTHKYWLVYPHRNGAATSNNYSNEMRVRLVDVSNPNSPSIGTAIHSRCGKTDNPTYSIAVSQQQDKIAVANLSNRTVDIFNFDNSTGAISLRNTITSVDGSTNQLYSVEFSPDGNQLYTATWNLTNADPTLFQYNISGTPSLVGSHKYWSQTENYRKGGGLKLGPDGKIYVTQSYTSQVGAISDPNLTTSLASRYNGSALALGVKYDGLQFSTGLTKPAVMPAGVNTPPTAVVDAARLCFTSSNKAVTTNVLKNDTDAENNTIYLTDAHFANSSDAADATLTVVPADSTIELTLRSGVNISSTRVFNIIYDIKDDGAPASGCSTGSLTVTAYPEPKLNSTVTPSAIYSGNTFSYTVNASAGASVSWERVAVSGISQSAATGTGNISEVLTNTTNQPVTVTYQITLNIGGCTKTENVTVQVYPFKANSDNVTATCDEMPLTVNVLTNDVIHSNSCSSPVVSIVTQPTHGTASLSGNNIVYSGNLASIDSLTYRITCGSGTSEAKIYYNITPSVSGFVDDVWYFGENKATNGAPSAGIRFVKNGSGQYVAQDASNESKVYSWENSLVVSSPYCDGQNIFYSSHDTLYNSSHKPMLNGYFKGDRSVADGLAACYMGNNKYLFFTVDAAYGTATPRALKAYVIDMNGDSGQGERLSEITVEPTSGSMSESVELVARAGTTDQYWLIYAHCNGTCTGNNNNELRVRLVDVSNPSPVGAIHSRITKSTVPSYTLRASQQYNRIAIANPNSNSVDIFDFDNSTGILSNIRTITELYYATYGVEFSPDGNQLYATGWSGASTTYPPMLYQYDISGATPVQVTGSPFQYWTQAIHNNKGGGLKLGPDGKIYVTQSYTNLVGAISNPNATTSLVDRYAYNAVTLSLATTYDGLQFSAGLTKPAVMACNMNSAPVAQSDSETACITLSSRTVTVDVLANDTDADGNSIYLTGAQFANSGDDGYATLSVDAFAGTVTLTVKQAANITGSHVFNIIYDIKDNGLPASQCSTGNLAITVIISPVLNSTLTPPAIYSGNTFSYLVNASAGASISWERAAVNEISQSAATGTGNISEVLTNTTELPVTVTYKITLNFSGCTQTENVTVTVYPFKANSDNVTATCDEMPLTVNVLTNDVIHSSCSPPVVSIVTQPTHGTASLNGNNIVYSGNLASIDSLTYRITCGSGTSDAKIYYNITPSVSGFVDDVWYFGENKATNGAPSAGIRFVKNGSGQYVAQDASNESKVYSWENSLVVSSPYCDGQNIFYSSHDTLYNSSHKPMLNGYFKGHRSVADGLAACYMGNNKYLFFTVDYAYSAEIPRALKAYVIDMNGDSGQGERLSEITVESESLNMSESVELVARAGTTHQYWLIYAHCNGTCAGTNNNELRVRLVDVSNPNNPVGTIHSRITKSTAASYTLRASQQYNRIAIANPYSNSANIFDFDNSTGILSNIRTITGLHHYTYGVEFSPDGNQFYATGWSGVDNNIPMLYQYDISSGTPVQVTGSPFQYWTQVIHNNKGGGLKLGPDGKIYVTQSYTNLVGAISNPNATTSLVDRYDDDAVTLSLATTYDGLQFSAGLTKPAVMACNMNSAPVAQSDADTACITLSSRTVTVNVLTNDSDVDGNTIYLSGAQFADVDDAEYATLAVDASAGTVTLTVKPAANITGNHVFNIIYDIKDNGLPASQCSTGNLAITAVMAPVLSSTLMPPAICTGTTFSYNAQSTTTSGVTFSWKRLPEAGISPAPNTNPTTSGSISETLNNNTGLPIDVTYEVTLTFNGCSNTQEVKVKVYGKLSQTPASPDNQAICHSNTPNTLRGGTVGGGSGSSYSYRWEQSDNDGATWTDVPSGGTSDDYSPPALTQTLKYRRIVLSDGGSCGRDTSNVLTIKVYPQSILDYPDFRIWACPSDVPGSEINLSKYLDTIELRSITWNAIAGSPAINSSGIIATDDLLASRTYTYTYTVTNPCVPNMTRKIYLKMLKGNSHNLPRDTIAICYEKAEAVNINQIFGIDAGGTWTYVSDCNSSVLAPYVTESAAHGGAVIMNGKEIYTDPSINYYSWHGITAAKRVTFTYTPADNSCLDGKTYRMVIILTPDMM